MSVCLEFTIDADDFQLGRVLSPPPGITLELERLVPAESMAVPFVWVVGDDYRSFEDGVRAHPAIDSLTAVDRYGNQGLYRLAWHDAPMDLLAACERSEAAILEASGAETWEFRLRFTDHDALSSFHTAVRELEIPISIDRIYPQVGRFEPGATFELTPQQRDALVLAVRRGYFKSPSEVRLEELAGELGISPQAVSKRIRRGTEEILDSLLLAPQPGDD